MLKIGDFSKVSKTTIKTLRYYDDIGLFKPSKVDENGYRYYELEKLEALLKIINFRELGFSIKEVKKLLENKNSKEIMCAQLSKLKNQKNTIEKNIISLEKIIEQGVFMKDYLIVEKMLPDYNVYYRHGVISSMDKVAEFVLQAGAEAREHNPKLECENYCFMTYTAKEYKEKDVELTYFEAVKGKVVESENIKSMFLKGGKALCVEHKGPYNQLGMAYAFILNYIKENNLEITGDIREVYIDGCWNKDSEDDYLTEIEVPIV